QLKCNVDASRLEHDGVVRFATIIRDSQGHVIEYLSDFKKVPFNVCSVEVFAIREALSWLKSLGLDNVMIESNC
ncbi:hypothetical protein Goarm_020553, partial [Gossypium armourianum]|nr:hypothetical protein [Gossypium armourianum]